MNLFRHLVILLFTLLCMGLSSAQTTVIDNSGLWFTLLNKYSITDNFYATSFIEYRSIDFAKESQFLFLSPGIGYQLNDYFSVCAGYMFVRGYIHLEEQATLKRDENRLWQSITFRSKINKVSVIQRLMFEERFRGAVKIEESRSYITDPIYSQRMRYRLTSVFNILELKYNKYLSAKISNEIRIRFGTGLSEPDFDQNNFNVFIGYQLFKNSKLWVGYQRDYLKINSEKFIANNILNICFSYHFEFRKQ